MLQSFLNQPDRISLNSEDDPNTKADGDFARFTIQYSTPVLQPRQMALLRATIPFVSLQVSDYQLCFFYYGGLSTATTTPTADKLRCIRLFPRQWQLGATAGTNMRWCNTPADLVTLLNTAAGTSGDNTTNNPYWVVNDVTFSYSTTTNQITFNGNGSAGSGYYCNAGYADPNVNAVITQNQRSVRGLTISATGGGVVQYACSDTTFIVVGTSVTISGFSVAGYNGTFTVTVVTSTTFTVSNSTTGTSTTTGSVGFAPLLGAITMPNTGGSGTTIQPLVPNQTLNSVLGYSYSGQFLPPQSFNASANQLCANLGGISLIKTASVPVDSFPNLVATQCLYIYSTVFGASGNTSSGQKNLLAVIPVNATNLQVINYIPQTPFFTSTKLSQQVYSFDVEIRDDNNQLFYLPDSANVNLEIGIKYDKPMTLRHEEQYA